MLTKTEKQQALQQLLAPDALTAWLANQPPDKDYVWQDPVFCMMGNYLRDHGLAWGDVAYSDLPHYEEIAGARPWTYGAALERAETLKQLPSPIPTLQLSPPKEMVVVEG